MPNSRFSSASNPAERQPPTQQSHDFGIVVYQQAGLRFLRQDAAHDRLRGLVRADAGLSRSLRWIGSLTGLGCHPINTSVYWMPLSAT
jgi:hypothetical protein